MILSKGYVVRSVPTRDFGPLNEHLRFEARREVLRIKTEGMKRVADITELERQMAAVEREAGITARFEEIQGHIKVNTFLPLYC